MTHRIRLATQQDAPTLARVQRHHDGAVVLDRSDVLPIRKLRYRKALNR
ncbi:hypothetical protein [Microbispora sp. CA-102843]